MTKRLLLFDIDGTLIDSSGAGVRSLQSVLRHKFGVIDDLAGVEVAGRTDTGIVHQILRKQSMAVTEENTATFLEHYLEFLAVELPQRQGRLLPGIAELLSRLQARPKNVLALLTGNLRRGAQLKLAHYGIWDFFEFGAFADDHHDRNHLGPFAQERAREAHSMEFAAANIDVKKWVNEGSLLWNFIGHGNPIKMADENAFIISDVPSLTNLDRLTFMIAASCDVGKFNDPSVQSLGERMVLSTTGGSIAVISATEQALSGLNGEPVIPVPVAPGSADVDRDGSAAVNELIAAVGNALDGCP